MARRRGKKIPVYVKYKPYGGTELKYGFQCHESFHNQYKGPLGQTQFAGATGVFFGCNAPKPNRASKEETTGTVSSFCSTSNINDLEKAGWTIRNTTRYRGVKSSGKTRTVYVPMPGGYNYAWNITSSEADLAGELGFQLAAGSTQDLIWGSSPKPPRASKKNGENRTVSTFIQPKLSVIEAAIGKGWSVSGVNYDLLPDT